MQTENFNVQIALKWLQAFNDRNLTNLLALYKEDAVHYSPKLKMINPSSQGFITGKEALKIWWQTAFERLPSLQYKLTSVTANSKSVFMEYVRKVNGEPDILVAEVLDIDELIIASRVYHG